jgi:hypothetical protein
MAESMLSSRADADAMVQLLANVGAFVVKDESPSGTVWNGETRRCYVVVLDDKDPMNVAALIQAEGGRKGTFTWDVKHGELVFVAAAVPPPPATVVDSTAGSTGLPSSTDKSAAINQIQYETFLTVQEIAKDVAAIRAKVGA